MIEPIPCPTMDHVVHMFNATLNAIQIVLVAWLTRRAVSKDRQERNGNHTELK